MSDFLTRLAARQLSRINTIQPRMAPLFATAEQVPSADFGRPDFEDQTAPRQPGSTPVFAAKSSEARGAVAAPAIDTANDAAVPDRPPRVAETDDPPMSGAMGKAQAVRAADQPVEARPKLEIPLPLVTRTAQVETRETRSQPVEKLTDTEHPRKANPTALHPNATETPMPLVSFSSDRSVDGVGPVDSLVAPVTLSPATGQYQKTIAPTVEPPVQVSIGRIEVTAVTAAPVQRRAVAPRKPAMSLDDYLARRQRGER